MTETSQTVPDRIGPDAWTKVQNMPWTARLELRRRVAWPLVRAQFAWHGVAWGADWKIFGRPIIQRHRGSRIALGDGLTLRSWPRSHPLALTAPVVLSTRRADAVLKIGEDCGFTGTTLVAADRITIGDRVLVGGNASIVDFDFHPLTPEGRAENINAGATAPILIGDDVFVEMGALVMSGLRRRGRAPQRRDADRAESSMGWGIRHPPFAGDKRALGVVCGNALAYPIFPVDLLAAGPNATFSFLLNQFQRYQ